MGNALLHLFVIHSDFYVGRIHKDLTGVYQFKFVTFLQYMGKYLFIESCIFKTAQDCISLWC